MGNAGRYGPMRAGRPGRWGGCKQFTASFLWEYAERMAAGRLLRSDLDRVVRLLTPECRPEVKLQWSGTGGTWDHGRTPPACTVQNVRQRGTASISTPPVCGN